MTEEEAKTKWCPYRNDTYVQTEFVCMEPSKENCMGSDCAMWVWSKTQSGIMPNLKFKNSTTEGHCGLIKV